MKGRKRPRQRSFAQEIAFEAELRRTPTTAQVHLLEWLRPWRKRPGRVFWMIDEAGVRRRV